MNTDSRTRKILLGVALYWLIVLLAGYLLMAPGSETGNGGGRGGYGGGRNGSGMAASGAGDGGGDEDRDFSGNTGRQHADALGAQDGRDDRNEAPAPQEEQAEHMPSGESLNEDISNGMGKATLPDLDVTAAIPTLKNEADAGTDKEGDGETSKVISGAEAKKGFFGVQVSGRERAVFILDISGSMGAPTAEGLTRLDLMKKIFSAELDRLYKATKNERLQSKIGCFMFASFSDSATLYPSKGNFSYASSQDLAQAKKQVYALNVEGGTAMMNAFIQLEKQLKSFRCDCVYLLTDGEPTDCDPSQLLEWLRKNLPKQKISTFSLGTQSPLLEDIAKQHHGMHREIH